MIKYENQYSKSHNRYVLHNWPFSFHIWSQIEATMCILCVLIIPVNSFYFWPLTRFLTETKTWLCQEDVPWATYYDSVYSHTGS